MLDMWIRNVKRAGVSNAMVVALDEETRKFVEDAGFASIVMTLQVWPPLLLAEAEWETLRYKLVCKCRSATTWDI